MLLTVLPLNAIAKKKVFKCLSGDCVSGEGEAYIVEGVYYKGTFKKSQPDGEGFHTTWGWAYGGTFKAGWKDGYGVEFEALKGSDGRYSADSSRPVTIGKWSTGTLYGGIRIAPDGTETYYSSNGFIPGKRPADPWMNAQADGYQAALARKGVVRKPTVAAGLKREGYQCTSGDCQNGTGTAVKYQGDGQMDYYYSGKFENGQLVEGTQINYSWAYVGSLRQGKYNGYGVRFNARKQGQDYLIDSASDAMFAKWKDGDIVTAATVNSVGERYALVKGEWLQNKRVKDEWISQRSDAFFALRKDKFLTPASPTTEDLMLAKKLVNVGRNTWAFVIEWNCATDRVYYLTAGSHKGGLPFAGVVMAQISGEDKLVVAEGEISRANPGTRWEPMKAWKPAKAGRYTFLLRFYQDEITGGRKEDYVSGVQLDCELHSSKQL